MALNHVSLRFSAVELTHVQMGMWVSTLIGRGPARIVHFGDRMRNHQFDFLGGTSPYGDFETPRAFFQSTVQTFEHTNDPAPRLCGEATRRSAPKNALT